MLIALDTSTATASVALFDGRLVLAELTWRAERRHADALFPALERLLALGGTAIEDVDRVAVAVGPGSFTGVRIGIAAAKGLARGRGAALAAVGTLDALAAPHAAAGATVCAALVAGGVERYFAFFEGGERRSPYLVGRVEDIAARVAAPTLFTGELDADDEAMLRELLGARATFAAPASRVRRAGYVAELGWRALELGAAIAPQALEPIYVKPPAVRSRLAISDRSPQERGGAAGQSPSPAPQSL